MASNLRSSEWYSGDDRNTYIHRAWMRRGVPDSAFSGRPQIAIANTASDLTPCNAHLAEVAQSVKNGIYEAGGIPLELPVVSLGETQVRPTAMLWRNMAAMATEEMLRANPIDGVVLLGGCDKTIPSLLMAAASVDLPAVVVPGGPMLTGHFRGEALGCGTDVWRLSEEVRAGTLSEEQFVRSESSMIRSKGHCNTMGTASTMALVAEALGTIIPGLAGTPAPDARLLEAAHETGRLAVQLVADDRRPSTFLTKANFHNAIVALAAIGGSTNAVVHLLAVAGRLGIDLTIDDFDRIGAEVPLLVNLQPAGRYLMDDLHRAGGFLAVLREVRDLLDPTALTITGKPLVDYLDDARIWDQDVIAPRETPLLPAAGISVLRGTLAPGGAIIKPAAASPTCSSTAAEPSCSTASRTSTPASTTPTLKSTRTRSWSCAAAAPRDTRACPRCPTCPCRRSCWRRGCATWSASAMAACQGPPTAPSSSTSPRRPPPAALSAWCGRATGSRSTSAAAASSSMSPPTSSLLACRTPRR